MSKFKVGDKVVCVAVGDNYLITEGEVYTVEQVNSVDEVRVCGSRTYYLPYRFRLLNSTQQKRAELKAAIELVQSYKIITTASQAYVNSDATYTFNTMGGGSLGWTGLEGLLDKLLPLESPQQKKLKELEKQQLEIVAKMEQLRSEL